MALKNNFMMTFIFLIFLSVHAQAKITLPELLAKQAVNNIRFLTRDGKFTYYQKRSGSLLFSTNYKVLEMMKSEIGTEYTLFATSAKKKIVILQNPNAHNYLSLRAKENIYLVDYGDTAFREIGKGIAPTLLLKDTWLSYYDPYSKLLSFENTTNSALKFSIKLNNRINPYFIPQVVMSDDNTVYYTDLSENGIFGLLEFKRNTSKSEIIFKAADTSLKIEMCINHEQLIMGTFGIRTSKFGSTISVASLPLKDFNKRENVYSSGLNDLGHLSCDLENSNIIFIKNFSKSIETTFEIVNLNLTDKKITALTEIKTASNIINMDGTILTQEKGKYFIVKGDVDYKNIDTLKAKQDLAPAKKPGAKESESEND